MRGSRVRGFSCPCRLVWKRTCSQEEARTHCFQHRSITSMSVACEPLFVLVLVASGECDSPRQGRAALPAHTPTHAAPGVPQASKPQGPCPCIPLGFSLPSAAKFSSAAGHRDGFLTARIPSHRVSHGLSGFGTRPSRVPERQSQRGRTSVWEDKQPQLCSLPGKLSPGNTTS